MSVNAQFAITNHNIQALVVIYMTSKSQLPPNLVNVPIGKWDVSNVTEMTNLFGYNATKSINEPLNEWDVSNVTTMRGMFSGCKRFNQQLNAWNVRNVRNMEHMFYGCESFNQPLNSWKVDNVQNMEYMFHDCKTFNQKLILWNVANVRNMDCMFKGCESFDQLINSWNVSSVIFTSCMFSGCKVYNQPLNRWNVINVRDMELMFFNCKLFNKPLNAWNVSNVQTMFGMFANCENFDQPLNSWNVGNVSDMHEMFSDCIVFDQPLDRWNVSNVNNMDSMFANCLEFDQPLNMWDVSNVEYFDDVFFECPISEENKPHFAEIVPHVEVDPYQIHRESAKINYAKLNAFFKSYVSGQMPADINYPRYIRETVTNIVQTSAGSEDAKFEIITKLARIMTERLNLFNYSEISPAVRESIFYGLEYVKRQSPEFKFAYADEFTHVCVTAYEGEDSVTCPLGAIERIVIALVVACKAMIPTDGSPANPEHEQLVDIITANPETLIPEYIKDWYKEHKMGTDGAFPENVTIDDKRASLRAFLLAKFPEEGGLIDRKIALFADAIGYDSDDFMFGGGTRRRKRRKGRKITRKCRRTRRKRQKKGRKTRK